MKKIYHELLEILKRTRNCLLHVIYVLQGCSLKQEDDIESFLEFEYVFFYGCMCNSFWCGYYMNRCEKKIYRVFGD